MNSRARVLFDGVVAGVLGAALVAVWFLIFDSARGHPLLTPALLGSTVIHGGLVPVRGNLIALTSEYSVLHFIAFGIFGIVAAMLLELAEEQPTFLLSLLIFFAAFEVFFIAVVMFLGPEVMAALTWWSILVGNLLATAAMLGYFSLRHRTLARNLLGPWLMVLQEGVLAGLIGGVIVALWFLVYDLIMGQALRTPALLGAEFFIGLRDPAALHISLAAVTGYTILHFMAFIFFGLAAAILIAGAEIEPLMLLGIFVIFVCFEIVFLGLATVVDQMLLRELGWWSIVGANILALAGMLGFLLQRHRALYSQLVHAWSTLELEAQSGVKRRSV